MGPVLYDVFLENLFALSTTGDLSFTEFANHVVTDYMVQLEQAGFMIGLDARPSVEDELQEEVLTMTRKKTYGYFSLKEYWNATARA